MKSVHNIKYKKNKQLNVYKNSSMDLKFFKLPVIVEIKILKVFQKIKQKW